jgi:zinc-ribbon domain
MSLIYCPECGHEVSPIATACPNCGHPFHPEPSVHAAPVPRVIVTDIPPEREGFPTWAFIPLGILAAVVLFGIFFFLSRDKDDANERVNINVAQKRQQSKETTRETTAPPSSTTTADSKTVEVPGLQTKVIEDQDKGTAVIDARVVARSGTPQAVKNEKFYLLDKDVESILNDSGLDPMEDQSMMDSFGLSVMNPGTYTEFNRRALAAIKGHIKYSTTTDGSGKGPMQNIQPGSYYLFGVTKTPEGYAIWDSPVSISAGQNNLNLSPARVTEVRE